MKLSNNVAEVHAFLHALRWARSPAVVRRPICLRHDSIYAALVSCGVYKAKKNKALVLHAQEEWKLTMKAKKGKLWIRHVKGHTAVTSGTMYVADELADQGRRGQRRYGPPVNGEAREVD